MNKQLREIETQYCTCGDQRCLIWKANKKIAEGESEYGLRD